VNFAGLDLGGLAAWFGVPAAALVALYLLRVRRRALRVAHLPLWTASLGKSRATSLFDRLRSPRSLLLQLALVAAFALALGDPWVGGPATEGCRHLVATSAAEARHHVILIDTSSSMATLEAGRPRLEEALGRTRDAITARLASPGARVLLATFDRHPRLLTPWTSDPSTVEAALAQLASTRLPDLGTDLPAALSFASDALVAAGTTASPETLAVISDFATPPSESLQQQLSQQQLSQQQADGQPSLPSFEALPVGKAAANLAIATFNLRPLPDDPLTYVGWYGLRNTLPREVAADLFVYANPAGRAAQDFESGAFLVATERVTLPPETTLTGRLPTLKFEGDRVMVRLAPAASAELTDALATDDRAFAVTPPRRRLTVLLVTAGNAFLEAALGLRENLDVSRLTPESWDGTARADVTVLDGVARHPAHSGPTLRIAPPDLPTKGLTEAVKIREPRVDAHRVVRHIRTADWGVEAMPIFSIQKNDRVILATERGEPVLWERNADDPTTRELVLGFDLGRSLLPVHVAFPVLMVEALNHLADEPDGLLLPLPTGHPDGLPLPLPPAAALPDAVTVTPPSGEPLRVAPRATAAATPGAPREVSVPVDLAEAGLWTLERPASQGEGDEAPLPPLVFAVSAGDPDEATLNPAPERWQPLARLSGRDLPPGGEPVAEAEATASTAPEPIWRWLLLGALALVVLDQLLWQRRWTS
jgi:hypothetical protein